MHVPQERVTQLNDAPERQDGRCVLYWMTAARRTCDNFALQHAVHHANRLGKPLVVLEAVRAGYQYASDRFHQFLLDGLADNQAAVQAAGATYLPYVERTPGAGRGLLAALSKGAALVVMDDAPQFFLPKMQQSAVRQLDVRVESVDGVGLLPRSVAGRAFSTAHAFRSFLQHHLPRHLSQQPVHQPLADLLPMTPPQLPDVTRWPMGLDVDLAHLPIDHQVQPTSLRGGQQAGLERLRHFASLKLARYPDDRNHPDRDGASGLSPYLHFGHVSAHAVFQALADAEDWHPGLLASPQAGSRTGWWGMSAAAEAFVDQLVTWRELGHLEATYTLGYDTFTTLPGWAQQSLEKHAHDVRTERYTLAELDAAQTADPLWNAAQNQLKHHGVLHNYLRMLWGKKILEWSPTPQEAFERMLHLNDKYALDGRDPNSVAGIAWVLGRYDRPWGPERPVYGVIRYMTSANTARKWETKVYVARHLGGQGRSGTQARLF